MRLPETSQPRGAVCDHLGVSSIQPGNATVSGRALEVVGPVLPPDRASYRVSAMAAENVGVSPSDQRAGLSGGSDARSIASSVRSPWLARFVLSPSEIDQWQDRPRPSFCFSDQTIRERVVRIVGRACSRRLRSGHAPWSVSSASVVRSSNATIAVTAAKALKSVRTDGARCPCAEPQVATSRNAKTKYEFGSRDLWGGDRIAPH
jgi:hypothetical protein